METVYILTNPSMPRLIKIGYTARESAAFKVSQLNSSTSLPTPFNLEYEASVDNGYYVVQELHSTFADYRISKKREFYNVKIENVIEAIKEYEVGAFDVDDDKEARDKRALLASLEEIDKSYEISRIESNNKHIQKIKEDNSKRLAEITKINFEIIADHKKDIKELKVLYGQCKECIINATITIGALTEKYKKTCDLKERLEYGKLITEYTEARKQYIYQRMKASDGLVKAKREIKSAEDEIKKFKLESDNEIKAEEERLELELLKDIQESKIKNESLLGKVYGQKASTDQSASNDQPPRKPQVKSENIKSMGAGATIIKLLAIFMLVIFALALVAKFVKSNKKLSILMPYFNLDGALLRGIIDTGILIGLCALVVGLIVSLVVILLKNLK